MLLPWGGAAGGVLAERSGAVAAVTELDPDGAVAGAGSRLTEAGASAAPPGTDDDCSAAVARLTESGSAAAWLGRDGAPEARLAVAGSAAAWLGPDGTARSTETGRAAARPAADGVPAPVARLTEVSGVAAWPGADGAPVARLTEVGGVAAWPGDGAPVARLTEAGGATVSPGADGTSVVRPTVAAGVTVGLGSEGGVPRPGIRGAASAGPVWAGAGVDPAGPSVRGPAAAAAARFTGSSADRLTVGDGTAPPRVGAAAVVDGDRGELLPSPSEGARPAALPGAPIVPTSWTAGSSSGPARVAGGSGVSGRAPVPSGSAAPSSLVVEAAVGGSTARWTGRGCGASMVAPSPNDAPPTSAIGAAGPCDEPPWISGVAGLPGSAPPDGCRTGGAGWC